MIVQSVLAACVLRALPRALLAVAPTRSAHRYDHAYERARLQRRP